jgi:hypothetical protein
LLIHNDSALAWIIRKLELIPGKATDFSPSPQYLEQLLGPFSVLPIGYQERRDRVVKLTTYLHLMAEVNYA